MSVTNGCCYGIACHTALARKAGMTDAMFGELMAVVGMANQTNRFADGYRLPIDAAFEYAIRMSCVCSLTLPTAERFSASVF